LLRYAQAPPGYPAERVTLHGNEVHFVEAMADQRLKAEG